jgi:hypothetical protein
MRDAKRADAAIGARTAFDIHKSGILRIVPPSKMTKDSAWNHTIAL